MINSKENFIKKAAKLIDEFNQFESGLDFSLQYSRLFNDRIEFLTKDAPDDIAITAAGGLSRMELTPFSDVDIVFIINSVEENSGFISKTLQELWDNRINVSHSIRTFNQIYEFAENDLTSFTQLLELRFISGSKNVFLKFVENVKNIINSELKKKLIESILNDIEKRHATYGKSPFLLEPNLKNTKGGIRDLHSASWLYYLINNEIPTFDIYDSGTNQFLISILNSNLLSSSEIKSIYSSYDYLKRLRNALHIINSNNCDRFDFQSQIKVTKFLEPGSIDIDEAYYKLMRTFFESTLTISRTLEFFTKEALQVIFPCKIFNTYELDEDFSLCGRFIKSKTRKNLSLDQILKVFNYQAQYNSIFSNELIKQIQKSVDYFDGTEATHLDVIREFRKILQINEDISDVLFQMHRLGILGLLIPEFDKLKFFFQPDAYHIYTTDEHTLMAIKNIYDLELENSQIGNLFRKYENKELLLLAILFHDIAKPITQYGHELIGAQIAENIMQRFGYSEDEIRIVSFLVENHLLMEQTAFRRNLNDATILNSFREKFKEIRELDFLYLLTYADLSAVNPSLWTSWKSSLLDDLYSKTQEMILYTISAEELLSPDFEKLDLSKYSIDKKEYFEHLELINDENYIYTFTEDEIASHIDEIKKGIILSILHNNTEEYTQLTVITKDTRGLLSKICGSISISDCNIHDASIFTRKDGTIIDTFKITDFINHKPLIEEHFEELAENLTRVLLQNYDLEKAFEEHRDKWKRVDKKLISTIDVEVNFENHPRYTIIDIHASDRIGLLYLITKKLTELGLNIYFAKIGTKLNGAFDSFYVLDSNLQKILPSNFEFIKKELTSALSNIERTFTSS